MCKGRGRPIGDPVPEKRNECDAPAGLKALNLWCAADRSGVGRAARALELLLLDLGALAAGGAGGRVGHIGLAEAGRAHIAQVTVRVRI